MNSRHLLLLGFIVLALLAFSCDDDGKTNPGDTAGGDMSSDVSPGDGGMDTSTDGTVTTDMPVGCLPDSCQQGAMCDDSSGAIVCTCLPGYLGDDCSECDAAAGYERHPVTNDCTIPCSDPSEIDCGDGCEGLNDPNNCGGCGIDCGDGSCSLRLECECPIDPNFSDCGVDLCVYTPTSDDHCGACGNACADNETCFGGVCQVEATDCNCPPGQFCCAGQCLNSSHLLSSRLHCGACGNACADGESCVLGACVTATGTCPNDCAELGGFCCDSGECIGTQEFAWNADHCGGCGIECDDGESCREGSCFCPADLGNPDFAICGGDCVNITRDSDHCGNCNNACAAGSACLDGRCVAGNADCAHQDDCGDGVCCDDGLGDFGSCAYSGSAANCGACGNDCGGAICDDGACFCPADVNYPGYEDCNGGCANLDNDPENCGACGNACGDDVMCVAGACVVGDDDLCGTCPNGVCCLEDGVSTCVDAYAFQSDPLHCGGCGNVCPDDTICVSGTCACPTDPDNEYAPVLCGGTCSRLDQDPENCGACGNDCGDNAGCWFGTCLSGSTTCDQSDCEDGQICCDDGNNSCRHPNSLLFDVENCGACGNECVDGETCQFGACSCPADRGDYGWLRCNGDCVQALADTENCGACGNVCGDGEGCIDGVCVAGDGSCPQPCGENTLCCADDGGGSYCAGLLWDTQHCGACGNTCDSGEWCNSGECFCNESDPNVEDCNGECARIDRDVAHCGGCGLACADGEVCVDGACAAGDCAASCGEGSICCDSVFGGTDCVDSQRFDWDRNHCGGCGIQCGDDENCNNGVCVCPLDYGDTDNFAMCNGECNDLRTAGENCGACGIACGTDEVCINGTCGAGDGDCSPVGSCDDDSICCSGASGPQCVSADAFLWDGSHCGGCGIDCGDGWCNSGECYCNGQNLEVCDGACTNTEFSAAHCGACGNACAAGEGCVYGTCTAPTGMCASGCDENQLCCADNSCVQTQQMQWDSRNCGGCGIDCGAGWCNNGTCTCEGSSPEGELATCDNTCVNLGRDADHCGACNNACGNGEVCMQGACISGDGNCAGQGGCGDDQLCCDDDGNGNCVQSGNLLWNNQHCGGCNLECNGWCQWGVCVCPNDPGYAQCDGECTHLLTDEDHCGACGTTCNTGEFCIAGSCVSGNGNCVSSGGCNADQICCFSGANGNFCTSGESLSWDNQNCGACGVACGDGWCDQGDCHCPSEDGDTNFAVCLSTCTDLRWSDDNCGTCGNSCGSGQVCVQGACVGGDGDCSASGGCGDESVCCSPDLCVGGNNLRWDSQNCGGCGVECGDGWCNQGACYCPSVNGDTDYAFCDNECTHLPSSYEHCGACNNSCTGTESCVDGVCTQGDGDCSGFGGCSDGRLCCDDGNGNGQCAQARHDSRHCGGCGIGCGDGWCNEYSCYCPADDGDSNYLRCNGECVYRQNNPQHCGACNNDCGTGSCSNGVCQ